MENEKSYESWPQVSNPSYWIESLMRILPNDHERSWDSETISAGTTCFLSWDLFLRNQEVMIVLRRSYPGTIIARMRILSETRHAEGNHPRKNWSRKILQVNGESIAGFSPGNFLLRTPLTIPRHPAKRLLLFYRYMLPHVTSEVYSWADPVEAFFGFKTGVENCFFLLIDDGVFAFFFHVLHQQWILL